MNMPLPDISEVLPNIDEEHKPFWNALRQHKFMLWTCKKCGARYWPVSFCRKHENDALFANMGWAEASGKGKVFVFNIHCVPFTAEFKDQVPYVYALVELEEGPLFSTNIVGCKPEDVKIGMPVEVVFDDKPAGFTLPKFKPVKP